MFIKKWIYNNDNFCRDIAIKSIKNSSLIHLLQKCEINTDDKLEKFLNPKLEQLYDPFLMNSMIDAVEIILNSIKNNEKILIYGDYDVDGVTSIVILYEFLNKIFDLKNNLIYDVADRISGGYGLSQSAVENAIKNKVNLLITVDCGIKDYDTIKIAKDAGIKVIVVDHHETDIIRINSADIILDPKTQNNKYPFRELSGCGVAFKLVCAILKNLKRNVSEAFEYLDLVGLSTACDLVPLIDENRILIYYGLDKINNTNNKGLKKLIELCEINDVDMYNILFKIGPILNSAGRLASAKMSIELLCSDDDEKIEQLCKELIKLNNERKRLCNKIIKEIESLLDDNKKSTVLFNKDWHCGILGIIASRCIEIKYRPTIILTEKENGILTGSARSIENINIYSILSKCEDLLIGFGGHKLAAGIKIYKDNLDKFKEKFDEEVNKIIGNKNVEPILNIDEIVNLEDIDENFYETLKSFGPFGIGNKDPIFASKVTCDEYAFEYNNLIMKLKTKKNFYFGTGYNLNDKENILKLKTFWIAYNVKNIIGEDIIFNICDIKEHFI